MSPNSDNASRANPAPQGQPVELPWQRWTAVLAVCLIIGVIGFVAGLSAVATRTRAWEAFLVNLLFWMGLAQGGVVVSSAFYLTQARWAGPSQYRLAEAFAYFIPLGFLLFWLLFFGRTEIFPWITHPIAQKEAWLNTPFLFARDGAALLLMTAVSMWFVRASRGAAAQEWARDTKNIEMPPPALRRLAPTVALTFAGVYSLLSIDLIMSLSPVWRSTLFPAYFFESCFWSAIALMAFLAVRFRSRLGPGNVFTYGSVRHDLGKFLFAFSVFWVYLLFAQYIVLWYGDIPAETFFIVVRINFLPWSFLSWLVLALVWVIPFFVLMGVRPKKTPLILGTVAFLGVVGIYLWNYVVVVPSLSPREIPYGWVEALVTLGFLGAFGLCGIPGLKRMAVAATSGSYGGATE
jgi:hypothetical protein